MWAVCFGLSLGGLVVAVVAALVRSGSKFTKKRGFNLFNALFASVFVAAVFLFYPLHSPAAGWWRAFLLSVFHSMQVFTIGCDFEIVTEGIAACPDGLNTAYQLWAATLFVLAPIFTFGFVLSLFKDLSAYLKYLLSFFKQTYIFSQLNERSLTLAGDIKTGNPKAQIVFAGVQEEDEAVSPLMESAKRLDAICFKKDISAVDFKKHSPGKELSFFAIGDDETENLNQALKLIDDYRTRRGTNLYAFSTKVESELLLTSVDKGEIKVRRINEVRSLINRVLYEQGQTLFQSAGESEEGTRQICAVVVGMGRHGVEMVKALTWFCQMDGYSIQIHAFDKDPLAEEKFTALAPELMAPAYNGVNIPGEAQYQITVHSGLEAGTAAFAREIGKLHDATYALVALGNDDVNINTAVNLRMYFERAGIHPVIQAIVYSSEQKKALCGIKNYRGQAYDIEFIGDLESSYAEDVIIDSELEGEALRRHLKWGNEEAFWTYEYNYRSSMASAIHMKARIACGIAGAGKKEEELTDAERDTIEVLEHRRWNAYMRAEGYIFSGSKESSSRNDLAKMHHNLVDFSSLTDADKRKDSRVGSR